MGFYTADGAVVNAAPPSPFIQGAASVSGTGSLAPAATRIVPTPEANPVGSGAATALLSVILSTGVAASATGSPEIFLSPTKIHSSGFAVSANASVSSFITRLTDGFSVITGQAQIIAIPADKIGNSDVEGVVTVAPDATRIVSPRAFAAADATVVADVTHTRNGSATVDGALFAYAEVGINGVFEAYGPVTAVATVTADALNLKFAGDVLVDVLGEATPNGEAIRTQRAIAHPLGIASAIVALRLPLR